MNGRYVRGVAILLAIALLYACPTTPEPSESPTAPESDVPAESELDGPDSSDRTVAPAKEPDVVYIPTPHDVVDMMLHLARVKRSDLVYDLGCGDGRIVVAAAKTYGCKAVGYDIDPKRVRESLSNVRRNKVQHLVRIEQKDIFTIGLSRANVVTLYLLPDLNVRLIPQLEKLGPGCRIVSHEFDMEGVRPDAVLTMRSNEDHDEHEIYLWTTPLKKEPVEEGEGYGEGDSDEEGEQSEENEGSSSK